MLQIVLDDKVYAMLDDMLNKILDKGLDAMLYTLPYLGGKPRKSRSLYLSSFTNQTDRYFRKAYQWALKLTNI